MKILVIRFSSIGDIVLTTPVLRCLKQQVPGAEVHYLTKEAFAPIVAHSPHVDRVHLLGDDLAKVLPGLRAERFDLVVDLHRNLRTWRVKSALGRPARSFDKLNIAKWLLVNLRKDRMPRVHIVDRYLATVAHLGVVNDGLGLEVTIPAGRGVPPGELPQAHQGGYVALCVGAAHATKRLPPHRLVELAEAIASPIVVIGGEEDRVVGRAIADAVGPRVFDATGRYDLLGSASLIRGARSVVAHDSAAMHLACAFARPTISVWGNTVPLFGMGPYMPLHPERAHVAEVQGLPCRPCSKIGHDQCPQGHFRCMERQDLGRIAALAMRG